MKFNEIIKSDKKFLNIEDISNLLNISLPSAKILASRYSKKGLLIRLKRNLYITYFNWQKLKLEDFFEIGNLLQIPSYISLTTALSYYGLTTQQTQNYIELIAQKRSRDRQFYLQRNFSLLKEETTRLLLMK
mgnify:CR=1 FL=1